MTARYVITYRNSVGLHEHVITASSKRAARFMFRHLAATAKVVEVRSK